MLAIYHYLVTSLTPVLYADSFIPLIMTVTGLCLATAWVTFVLTKLTFLLIERVRRIRMKRGRANGNDGQR